MTTPLTTSEKIRLDLHRLRLSDMATAVEAVLAEAQRDRQGYLEFLDRLVSRQVQGRAARSLERRLKKARLTRRMTFESFDWSFQEALNVEQVKDLAGLGFIAERRPLLILGRNGTGKTHLATAFGVRACEAGYRVAFYELQELLARLYATLAADTTAEALAELARLDLLIIDAVGHIRTRPEYPGLFLDLVNTCHRRTALLVTSSLSFQEWGAALGHPAITTAIVDRLFDRANLVRIFPGRSYNAEGPDAPRWEPGVHGDGSETPAGA